MLAGSGAPAASSFSLSSLNGSAGLARCSLHEALRAAFADHCQVANVRASLSRWQGHRLTAEGRLGSVAGASAICYAVAETFTCVPMARTLNDSCDRSRVMSNARTSAKRHRVIELVASKLSTRAPLRHLLPNPRGSACQLAPHSLPEQSLTMFRGECRHRRLRPHDHRPHQQLRAHGSSATPYRTGGRRGWRRSRPRHRGRSLSRHRRRGGFLHRDRQLRDRSQPVDHFPGVFGSKR